MEDKNCLNRIRVLRAFDPGDLNVFTFDKYLDISVRRLFTRFTDYDVSDPTVKRSPELNPVNEIVGLYKTYNYSLIGALVNNLHLIYDASVIHAKLGLLFQEIEKDCQTGKTDRECILGYLDKFSETSIESLQEATKQLLCLLYSTPQDINTLFDSSAVCWDTKYLFYKGHLQNELLFSELLKFIQISVSDYSVSEYQLSLLIDEFIHYKGQQAYGENELRIRLQRGRYLVRDYVESRAALRSVYYKNIYILGNDLLVIFKDSYAKRDFFWQFIDPLLIAFGEDDNAKNFRRKYQDFLWLKEFSIKNRIEDLFTDAIRNNFFFCSKYSIVDDEAFRQYRLIAYAGISNDDIAFKNDCNEIIEMCQNKRIGKEADILKRLTVKRVVIFFLSTDSDVLKWHLWKMINKLTSDSQQAALEFQQEISTQRARWGTLPRILYSIVFRKYKLNNT